MKQWMISGLVVLGLLAVLPFSTFAAAGNQGTGYLLLDDNNFDSKTAGKLVIVDFYADWCGPCQAFAPTFATVAQQVSGVLFAKVDTDAAT